MRIRHAAYLVEIFQPQKIVDAFKMVVPRGKADRKNIVYVGIGLSGTAAIFILKQAGLVDRIAIVRKKGNSHSTFNVEMSHDVDMNTCHWIFVDDMIDTGRTFQNVLERLNVQRFEGALLYHCEPVWKPPSRLIKRYGDNYI